MNRKPIFDAVRQLPGRSYSQGEVDEIDGAINRAMEPPPSPARKLGQPGNDLIKRFEGCGRNALRGRFETYPDPGTCGDPRTIGRASTGAEMGPRLVWPQAQCDARSATDMQRYADEVGKWIRAGGKVLPNLVRRRAAEVALDEKP
jgi:GH24 family phage-related lysozyme (muramidase)